MMEPKGEYKPVSKEGTDTTVPIVVASDDHEEEQHHVESFDVAAAQTWTRGEVQEAGYKDVYFAVAFYIHLAAVVLTTILFGVGAIETSTNIDSLNRRKLADYVSNTIDYDDDDTQSKDDDEVDDEEFAKLLSVIGLSLVIAPILAVLALGMMKRHALALIKFSLFFSIGFSTLLALVSIAIAPPAAIFYGILAAILIFYAKRVWHRIPYAASNLRAAITAIEANLGIAVLAFCAVPVKIGWYVLWGYTLYKTMQTDFMKNQVEEERDPYRDDDEYGDGTTETLSPVGWVIITLFTLSLYWTSEVIRNVVHTTIAGVIGTWWFLPEEASSFFSKGLRDSFARSMTYSFGSICFGSLIVAILEVIKNSLRNARNNRNGGVLRCIAYCLLVWIERLAEYFNKWAFIYVGCYGYSYLEAGKAVMTLFRARGWTTIISDNLVYRMLGMMCLAIGLVSALVGVLLALSMGITGGVLGAAALLCFFTGFAMSALMMSAVGSSVDSIIVLFCEAPAEFEENHPELAREMEATWTEAWCGVFTAHAEPVPQTNVV